MIKSLKRKLDNTSYLKFYIYLSVLLICLILWLFVFSSTTSTPATADNGSSPKDNTQQVAANNSDNSTATTNNNSAKENSATNNSSTTNNKVATPASGNSANKATNNTNNSATNSSNSSSNSSSSSSSNTPAPIIPKTPEEESKFVYLSPQIPKGYLPPNQYNEVYKDIPAKIYTIFRGQNLSQLFFSNGYDKGELFGEILPANRRFVNNVNIGDKVLIKSQGGRVVVLSVVDKFNRFQGQIVYITKGNGGYYKFFR